MSSENRQPGSRQVNALELQSQQREADAVANQAYACAIDRPEEAFQLFLVAMKKWDAAFNDQEAFLHQQLEQFQQILERPQAPLSQDDEAWLRQQRLEIPQQIAELRQAAINKKVHLFQGQGQVAYLLGKLPEAKVISEQALALLGDRPSEDRASLLLALARIDDQGEWHGQLGIHSVSEADGTPYDGAYEEFLAIEQWHMAVQARALAADWAYFRGQRSMFLCFLDEAIQLAKDRQIKDLERKLRIRKFNFRLTADPTGETLQTLEDEWSQIKKLARENETEYIDALMLRANLAMAQNDLDTAEEFLQEAKEKAERVPEKQWSVQVEYAGLLETRGQIDRAIQHTEEALGIANKSGIVMQIVATLRSLIPLRAKMVDSAQQEHAQQEMDELRRVGSRDELALTLLQRATVYHGQRQFKEALSNSEEARQCAPTVDLIRRALMIRAATFHALDRDAEALAAILEAIALLNEPAGPHTKQSFDEWRDRLNEVEALHAAAAWLTAKFGRTREAFEWAEDGKSQSLHRELARVEIGSLSKDSKPTFNALHDWLSSEACAIAMFCVTAWGTLILVLEPQEIEPRAFFVNLTVKEIDKLLSLPHGSENPERWREVIFGAETLRSLSQELLHPLQDVLQEIARQSLTLYIIPDASLYRAPFAALTFADGTPLVGHFALAHAPSVAILVWCCSRRLPQTERTCLVVGLGSSGGISFVREAQAVAELPWKENKFLPEAKKEDFWKEASYYSVLHLSCHGRLGGLDTLSASQLVFANNQLLTAKEVFTWEGRLHADLVFLSACLSGRFRSGARSEVDGFWRAFLHAGAASLIATLISVDPDSAEHLALNFYQAWLKGDVTKAEALRQTQYNMFQKGYEPHHWAAHILIGDHH